MQTGSNGVNLEFVFTLTLKVKVNRPKNNGDLNQGLLRHWSKFDDPSLNE